MAAPHSTALVALIWNAAPCLIGDVPMTKQIMMQTAEPKIDAQCPPFVDHPNDVWGWGILDALAAVQAAGDYCGCEAPDIDYVWSNSPVELGQPMQFEVQLTAGTEPLAYTWDMDGPGNGVGLDTPTPVFTYTLPGTYTPTVTVANVCGSDHGALTVEVTCDPPVITDLWSNSPVELGEPMNFEVQVTGVEPLIYTWDFGGSGYGSGLDTATPVFTYTDPGAYTVTVTVDDICGSDVGELGVEVTCDPPVITDLTSDSPVELGEPMHLEVQVAGTEPFTYTWDMAGPGSYSGLDTATPVFTYTEPGIYTPTVMVENACGSASDELPVAVFCDPPEASFTSNSPVTIGEPISFTAMVSGTQPLTYTWSFGGPGEGSGLDTPFPVFTYTTYGSFTAVMTVTNPCGTDVFSDEVAVLPQTIYLPILFKGAGG
jgi:PKD repeat protein